MKTSQRNVRRLITTGRAAARFGALLLGCVVVTVPCFAAGTDNNFEMNALLNPGQGQLAAEKRGRVMIYDGLDNQVIEHALDTQFERIDRMMFIRIRRTEADGSVTVDDDDC